MHSLAIRYSEAGRRGEALQLTEQVVALHKIKLGEDHPDTLQSMHSLSIQYSEAGRRGEALQLTEQVVALRKVKLGEDHPATFQSIDLQTHIKQEIDKNSQRTSAPYRSQNRRFKLWERFQSEKKSSQIL
jgi:Tetratricopeptide repeat